MDRVTFTNSREDKLAGVLHVPLKKTSSIIIMAHGFTGDKDEWGRFVKAAQAFCDAGFAVLRFDFSGSGESGSTPITIKQQVDDLKSAVRFVKAKGYSRLALLGLSLGGLCSVRAYGADIETLVLWAPVTKPRIRYYLNKKEQIIKNGFIFVKTRAGKELKIDPVFVKESESVDQIRILSRIQCPILIIHGDQDDTIPLEDSKSAMNYLPKGSKLEIIKGANHVMEPLLDKAIELSLEWFKNYLRQGV